MYLPSLRLAVASIALIALLTGCRSPQAASTQAPSTRPAAVSATQPAGQTLARHEYKRYRMGVVARVVLYTKDSQEADDAADAVFHSTELLDQVASDYRRNSEAMLLCAKAGGPPVRVSRDLFVLLQRSCEVSRLSDGAYDCTIGPITTLWREARKTGKMPTPEEVRKVHALVNWRNIRLDAQNQTAQLLVPGMKLDFGGIAKGYAADRAIEVLKARGITRALFEAGGDIAVGDAPPDFPGWNIEIMPETKGGKPRIVSLTNCAISTSGDTEQYILYNGQRLSHIIDPRTGFGLTDRTLTTIIGPDGLTTDSLSTAAAVLGEKAPQILGPHYPGTQIIVRKAE